MESIKTERDDAIGVRLRARGFDWQWVDGGFVGGLVARLRSEGTWTSSVRRGSTPNEKVLLKEKGRKGEKNCCI